MVQKKRRHIRVCYVSICMFSPPPPPSLSLSSPASWTLERICIEDLENAILVFTQTPFYTTSNLYLSLFIIIQKKIHFERLCMKKRMWLPGDKRVSSICGMMLLDFPCKILCWSTLCGACFFFHSQSATLSLSLSLSLSPLSLLSLLSISTLSDSFHLFVFIPYSTVLFLFSQLYPFSLNLHHSRFSPPLFSSCIAMTFLSFSIFSIIILLLCSPIFQFILSH